MIKMQSDASKVDEILKKFRDGLTIQARKKIEDGHKLSSDFLISKSDPETFTEDYLIEPMLKLLGLSQITRNKHFDNAKRRVDYLLQNENGLRILLEGKPLNSDLRDKSEDGAVNQITGIFKLRESEKCSFGIATDGSKWIIFDNGGKEVGELVA